MSDRDKRLLVYLGALVILAAAYFLVAKPLLDKIDTLSSEKTELQSELSRKREDFENKGKYEQGISEAKDKLQALLDEFPEDNSDEKSIMFVSHAEADVPIWFNQVRFAEETKNLIASAEGEEGEVQSASDVEAEAEQEAVAAAEGEESLEAEQNEEGGSGRGDSAEEEPGSAEGNTNVNDLMYRDTELGLSFETTYDGFKNLLAYIRDYKDRMVIKSIDVTYEEAAGLAKGTLVLSQYAVLGPGRVLPEVETKVEDLGVQNIFMNRNHGGSIIDLLANIANDLLSKIIGGVTEVATEGTDPDFFIKVNANTDNTSGKTIGKSDDLEQGSYVISEESGNEDITFRVSGSDGKYKIRYSIGENTHKETIEKEVGQEVYLRVISSERMSDSDDVSISLHVINKSDTPVTVSVEGEDEHRPRVDIVEKDGDITIK